MKTFCRSLSSGVFRTLSIQHWPPPSPPPASQHHPTTQTKIDCVSTSARGLTAPKIAEATDKLGRLYRTISLCLPLRVTSTDVSVQLQIYFERSFKLRSCSLLPYRRKFVCMHACMHVCMFVTNNVSSQQAMDYSRFEKSNVDRDSGATAPNTIRTL